MFDDGGVTEEGATLDTQRGVGCARPALRVVRSVDPDEVDACPADEDVAWALDATDPQRRPPDRRPSRRPPADLDDTALRAAPTTMARERTLPVVDGLAALIPGGALQRGWVVGVGGVGATSTALALSAGATAAGSWLALVGLPSAGLPAAAGLGVDLGRVVVVDAPPPEVRAQVLGALLAAFELVLVGPEARLRSGDARRLATRARERGSVLVAVTPTDAGRGALPDGVVEPDLSLTGTREVWQGLDRGHGHLRSRRLSVETTGRRAAARRSTVDLWLPGPDGEVAVAEPGFLRSDPPLPGHQRTQERRGREVATA